MKRIGVLIATSCGAGYSPVASGTAGSAVGILIYFFLQRLALPTQWAIVALMSLVGIWASSIAEKHFGREDPGEVVIDEVAGQLLTLVGTGVGVVGIVVGFFLFRVLDIFKPWPARQFENFHGGLGIMADDLMVAVYGNLILHIAVRLLPGVF